MDDLRAKDVPVRTPGLGARPYLIGIGGCGMSALARLLAAGGCQVQGSDSAPDDNILADLGIRVESDRTDAIPPEIDTVIASAAIRPDHPQLVAAADQGRDILTYAEALGRAMNAHTGVAIAGTHGKSTTAAMLGCALTDARLDPSVIVGAQCAQLADGCLQDSRGAVGSRLGAARIPDGERAGAPGLLIAEACEFNRSFHNLNPTIASISAVEADHLDIYGSLDAIIQAFAEFARLVPPESEGGRLLVGHDGAHRREIGSGARCGIETIGLSPEADWVVKYDPETRRVGVSERGQSPASWTNAMPGHHNAMNSATAYALARMAGADADVVCASLERFRGVQRRMEFIGERDGVRVFDDYGHHPSEIEATLRAFRQAERPEQRGGRLICVFQPHQHSRTRFFLDEFANSFSLADVVIVPHIYFVRDSEVEKQKVSSADLVDRLRARGVRAMHLYPFEAIVEHLENLCRPGDLVVVMGAGPVWQVAHSYVEGAR